MKKNSVLIAKILVVIIIIGMVLLSFVKLADTLRKPSLRLYKVIESVNSDISTTMDFLTETDIYKLVNYDTYQLSIDSKIKATGLAGSDFERYTNLLNSSSFALNMKVDKPNNYLTATLHANNDNNSYNMTYVENKNNKYIKDDYTNYLYMPQFTSNLKVFNPLIYKSLSSIFENSLKEQIKEEDVTSKKSAIGVNGKTYDVLTSSYLIKGSDLLTLLAKNLTNIKTNSEVISYLSGIFGSVDNASSHFTKIIQGLKIDTNVDYILKGHTKQNNGTPLKLELVENNQEERLLFSYTRDETGDYHILEYNQDGKIIFYMLEGSIDNFKISLNDGVEQIEFTHIKGNDKNSGEVIVKDMLSNTNRNNITYSYQITPSTSGVNSISLNMTFKPYHISTTANINMTATILITKGVSVAKENITSFDTEPNSNADFTMYAKKYLENYYNMTSIQTQYQTFMPNIQENTTFENATT